MKTLLLLSLAITVSAQPRNQLERALNATTRVIYEYPVDITPYVKWRKDQKGERPMSAWHYLTGKITRAGGREWEMEVQLEGFGEPVKIILRNPPTAALNEFLQLKQQHAAITAELAASVAIADEAENAGVEARAKLRATPLPTEDPGSRNRTRASYNNFDGALADASTANLNESYASVRASRALAAKRNFDARGYALNGEFQFKGYAVRTKEKHPSGLPIFDHGGYR